MTLQRLGRVGMGLVLILWAVWIGLWLRPIFYRGLVLHGWTAQSCEIIESSVQELPGDSDAAQCVFHVKYRYKWNGRTYESTTYDLQHTRPWHRERAEELTEEFKVGAVVPCYVNPDRPEQAVLARGGLASGIILIPLVLFVVAGVVCVRAELTRPNQRAAQVSGGTWQQTDLGKPPPPPRRGSGAGDWKVVLLVTIVLALLVGLPFALEQRIGALLLIGLLLFVVCFLSDAAGGALKWAQSRPRGTRRPRASSWEGSTTKGPTRRLMHKSELGAVLKSALVVALVAAVVASVISGHTNFIFAFPAGLVILGLTIGIGSFVLKQVHKLRAWARKSTAGAGFGGESAVETPSAGWRIAKIVVAAVLAIGFLGCLGGMVCELLFASGKPRPSTWARFPLGAPAALAVGNDGRIYCALAFYHRVQVYSHEGEFLRGWFVEVPKNPRLEVDASHCLHVLDEDTQTHPVFDPEGRLVREEPTVTPGQGEPAERLPSDQAIDAVGNHYEIRNPLLWPRIVKKLPDGQESVVVSDFWLIPSSPLQLWLCIMVGIASLIVLDRLQKKKPAKESNANDSGEEETR